MSRSFCCHLSILRKKSTTGLRILLLSCSNLHHGPKHIHTGLHIGVGNNKFTIDKFPMFGAIRLIIFIKLSNTASSDMLKRKTFYQTNVCPPWPETLPAPLINNLRSEPRTKGAAV